MYSEVVSSQKLENDFWMSFWKKKKKKDLRLLSRWLSDTIGRTKLSRIKSVKISHQVLLSGRSGQAMKTRSSHCHRHTHTHTHRALGILKTPSSNHTHATTQKGKDSAQSARANLYNPHKPMLKEQLGEETGAERGKNKTKPKRRKSARFRIFFLTWTRIPQTYNEKALRTQISISFTYRHFVVNLSVLRFSVRHLSHRICTRYCQEPSGIRARTRLRCVLLA